jgi:hypothetical protein
VTTGALSTAGGHGPRRRTRLAPTRTAFRERWSGAHGQSVVEFALVLPVVLVLSLGVVEAGYALLDVHVVTKLSREGSNLISRDTSLQDAAVALRSMSSRPVNFDDGSSTVIFSVIKNVSTSGASNYGRPILYQRYAYGSLPARSALETGGAGSFGVGPDHRATNPNGDTNLQITNLPANVAVPVGGLVYVTEIYSRHPLITPVDALGIVLPDQLYSIAYF